jgi:hypothetical protein
MANLLIMFIEANMIAKARHPPYLPDGAPSDFFLFSEVKRRLSRYSFDNADEFLGAIHDILAVSEAGMLNRVFCEWMARLQ